MALRFDRNELSGAFGDLGTDFPLIVGMILVGGLDAASVLVLFGAMQILTGVVYGLPMPVQPLKAMAVIVITQRVSGDVLAGGGLAIGVAMLLLSVTGLIDALARAVPKSVVRGIQFGLGLQLASLALKDYVPADGAPGFALAAVAFVITIALLGNRRLPPAPLLIALGVAYALALKLDGGALAGAVSFALPKLQSVTWDAILTGALLLALPQIPLSLGNSILATRQVVADLFPEKRLTVRKISFTYALMNLISPWLGGIPTCHGSGGMVGHYAFGGRTGGSVVIEGSLYVALGLFFSGGFQTVIELFPRPVLGVILLFEAVALLLLLRDMLGSTRDFTIVALAGLAAFGLPYGYLVALLLGTALAYWWKSGVRPQSEEIRSQTPVVAAQNSEVETQNPESPAAPSPQTNRETPDSLKSCQAPAAPFSA
ncbi:MAG: putative sulfate/molybdate transporter [Candidatus Acidiferrales bacterium]